MTFTGARPASLVGGATMAMTVASIITPALPANAAAPHQVTTNADHGSGSLREVLGAAVTGDTITFAASVTGSIDLLTPLTVSSGVNIVGPGAGVLSIDGGDQVQDFIIDSGAADVTISGLTITHGKSSDVGGGIDDVSSGTLTLFADNVTNNAAATNGGGIYNDDKQNIVVASSTISGNIAQTGGGIFANQPSGSALIVERSTISGNTATLNDGAAIYANGDATYQQGMKYTNYYCDVGVLTNTNQCEYAASSDPGTMTYYCPYGGALSAGNTCYTPAAPTYSYYPGYYLPPGTLTLEHSTVADNVGGATSGAIAEIGLDGDSVIGSTTVSSNTGVGLVTVNPVSPVNDGPKLAASIVAGNTADCAIADLTDAGYNVDGDGTCGLSATGSVSSSSTISAALGSLRANGGPTKTIELLRTKDSAHAVVPASFHLPNGGPAVCTTPDQRGVLPAASPCDIGAFQREANPKIAAHVTSKSPKTSFGWYGSSVHVSFTCTSASPRITVACSRPKTVAASGKHQKVKGTARAQDGRIATTKRKFNVDLTPPTVTRIKPGSTYSKAPTITCDDGLSGIATCKVHRGKPKHNVVHFTVTAIDKAGNRTQTAGSYGLTPEAK